MENKIESKEKERSFEDANSWEELNEILDEKEVVVGAHEDRKYINNEPVKVRKEYNAAELKGRIEKVREGNAFMNSITSSEGLRDKVIELKVQDVESWKDMKELLAQMYGLEFGGSEKRNAGYWLERVEDIEKHDLDPIHMTSKYGFRSKAIELRNK